MINKIAPSFNISQVFTPPIKKTSMAFIMDACPMMRRGLYQLLKESLFKADEIRMLNKVADVPMCLASSSPNVIVMELCGEGESVLDGLGVISTCQKHWPLTPLVICTSLTDLRFLQQLKRLGVASICHKHDPLPAIELCIESAMAGSCQDSPAIQRLLLSHIQPLPMLTGKEIDVLGSLLAGHTVSRIAQMLHRDIRTISTHKCSAMAKLGFKNDGELFSRGKWMARNGLFE